MFVGRKMTRDIVTVTKDTSVLKVSNLLKEHNIGQVPVVEGKKLIGIISDKDIRENSASPASTLSVHELNYLLSEMKASQIMTRKVITTTPGTAIEEAARKINQSHVNSLPVVAGDELVGIITTCDILNVFVDFMGIDTESSRVELTLSNDVGEIEKVVRLINDMGLKIVSIVSSVDKKRENARTTLVRVACDNPEDLCERLDTAGFKCTREYKVDRE